MEARQAAVTAKEGHKAILTGCSYRETASDFPARRNCFHLIPHRYVNASQAEVSIEQGKTRRWFDPRTVNGGNSIGTLATIPCGTLPRIGHRIGQGDGVTDVDQIALARCQLMERIEAGVIGGVGTRLTVSYLQELTGNRLEGGCNRQLGGGQITDPVQTFLQWQRGIGSGGHPLNHQIDTSVSFDFDIISSARSYFAQAAEAGWYIAIINPILTKNQTVFLCNRLESKFQQ